MSGPIVRKYGFPNFDRIFGSRPVEHGKTADPSDQPSTRTSAPPEPTDPPSPLAGEAPNDLVPDVARGAKPLDAESASESHTMAPSTEFGTAGG